MSNNIASWITLIAFLAGVFIIAGISYAFSYPQLDTIAPFTMEIQTSFKNEQGVTFVGVINNENSKPLFISGIYLEVYDPQGNLIGFVKDHNPLTLLPNSNSAWKVTVTEQDVPSLDLVDIVASGASVINTADFQ